MRFLLGLVLILRRSPPAAPTSSPDGWPARRSRSTSRKSSSGPSTPLEVDVQAPGARCSKPLRDRPRAERQAVPAVLARPTRRARRSSRTAPTSCVITPRDRQAGGAGAAVGRRRASSSPRPRKVLYGIRTVASTARARRSRCGSSGPRVSVVSTHHYINHGGTEMVVYRATPEDVDVRRGRRRRRVSRLPGGGRRGRRRQDQRSGAARRVLRAAARPGSEDADPRSSRATRPATPRAPTSTTASSRSRSRRSRIELDDTLLDRVVPAILEGTTEVKPEGDNAREVPRHQRRAAPEEQREDRVVRRRRPRPRCCGAASCSTRSRNTAVESAFADHRTYIYKGKEVDQQVHLGFDLASFAGTPIVVGQPRQGPLRRGARHLRQLRHHRPRDGRAVALRRTSRRSTSRPGRRSRRNSSSAAAA